MNSLRNSQSTGVRNRPVREDLVTQTCLEVFRLIRAEGRLADRALESTLRQKRTLFSNERREVAERIYDLMRRELTVDYLLRKSVPRFEQIAPSHQDLLRLCAARVLRGEPPRQVASDARLEQTGAALLDSVREGAVKIPKLELPDRLVLGESFPEFLVKKFMSEFGEDADQALRAMNSRAPLTARVNLLQTTRDELARHLRSEGVDSIPTKLSPLGLHLETRLNAFSLKAFRAGQFEIQDEGSQLLGMLVDAPPGIVVDACAGAGGKTLQMAAQMKNRGELFAVDIGARAIAELRRRARRAGVHNARTRLIAKERPAAEEALSDLRDRAVRVLVDAPCSGTGTLRRKPDARYRLTPELLAEHVARQRELLRLFARLVKPGGRLIYGTCSALRDENEAVVEWFLQEHGDFSLKPAASILGSFVEESALRHGYLRLTPHQHGTDGFFGAVLERR
jgi:16S rRNA (cytosine967-C5)-methyltransferase